LIEKLAGAVTALAGCPASLSQDAVGFRIEPVGKRHPELRRKFQFDAHVPELIDPVACVHGGVLHGMQLVGLDGPHPPVPRLLLQGLQTVLLGDVQQVGSRPRAFCFRLHQLACLSQ
jgi:hypothetical protein